MFEIIEILLIIIILSCVSNICICVFFWLDNVGRLFYIFIGVILVGVIIRIGIIIGFVGLSLYVFIIV